ncbi:MAG: hypothetical protein Q8S13_14440 [Dehalococcoidia bacterium]|nr:hypothetical protein [Dehalococcoidia bacterium]
MRELGMVLALAFGVAGGLRAQATDPQVDVTGRAIVLRTSRGAPQDIRGELLAVRRDSIWVLAGTPERIVAVRLGDVLEATVRRHGLTAARGFLWGLGVGAASGVGLAVACSQVSDGCGGVAVGSTLFGGVVGGVTALSFFFSSRWRFRPVTAEKLEPFARFPQGPPPGGFDVLLRPARDSLVVRP